MKMMSFSVDLHLKGQQGAKQRSRPRCYLGDTSVSSGSAPLPNETKAESRLHIHRSCDTDVDLMVSKAELREAAVPPVV